MKNYTIRTEQPRDFKTVENLTREAFWNVYRPGCTEHYVLHCYRSEPDFVPELSLVLEVDGEIIGHVMYAWSHIDADDGRKIRMMTFGPISIRPDYKRKGYGKNIARPFHANCRRDGRGLPPDLREHRVLRQERLCGREHQGNPLR